MRSFGTMCLPPSIAHYRITAKLGEGGMGEVYRATDTKLGRDVAIKVIPEEFAKDANRMARFAREAQVLASLNHTNIAAIYGVEDRALVLELVDGPTLAERTTKGPMPVDEALPIARQISEAVEYAHAHGVIHRDLKPANIKLTPEGRVKVLDFGLAKLTEQSQDPMAALTQTMAITGTPGYLAPEQLQGKPADARSDIFAFGCVLYELLSGRRAFPGKTLTASLAATAMAEPKPIEGAPKELERLIRRCIRKDPGRRIQTMADLRVSLEELEEESDSGKLGIDPAPTAFDEGQTATPPRAIPSPRRNAIPWAVAGVAAVVAACALWAPWRPAQLFDLPLTRLSVDLGPEAMTGLNLTAAISPDGRRLVFPARAPNGKQQLVTQLLDQAQPTFLPGTENGHDPFFSPDGQWLGFFADSRLKKTPVQGGTPVTLCDAPSGNGGSWGEDGRIIAALGLLAPLSRVPTAGGRPEPLTRLEKGESSHRWPQILPGGAAVVFTAAFHGTGTADAKVEVMSLNGGAAKTLVEAAYFGRVIAASGRRGYLVYLHQGVLFGVAFDLVRLELQGTPVPLLEHDAANPIQGGGQFDFSRGPSGHGTLFYLAGKQPEQMWPVVWLDSSGKTQPLIATPGTYGEPRFSPDGRRLALTMNTTSGTDLYSYDLLRETMTRLTFDGHADVPVWTPDGKHLVFNRTGGDYGLWWIRTDASGEPQRILASQYPVVAWSFSPDGRRLAYREVHLETGVDILTLPIDTGDPDHPKPGKPEPFLATPADEFVPMFSPDGRWIAYRSNESGTSEIYVRPFPGGRGGKWQISTGGGLYAMWSNGGRELFYETTDNRIMVVDYTVDGDSFAAGKPRLWSETQLFYPGSSNLALAADGKRFAVFPLPEAAGPERGSVHVIYLQNFLDELRRRIPAR